MAVYFIQAGGRDGHIKIGVAKSVTKPTIEEILTAGRLEFETPSGWRAADLGLRNEIIVAALKIHPADTLHAALLAVRKRHCVVFRDDALDLTVRWSPG